MNPGTMPVHDSLAATTLTETLDAKWAAYLGCKPAQLRDGARHVVARPDWRSTERRPWPLTRGPICLFTAGQGWVLSVPHDLTDKAHALCGELSFGELVGEGDRLQQDWFDKLGTERTVERPSAEAYPAMHKLAESFRLRGWSHYVFSYANPASWKPQPDRHVCIITEGKLNLWDQWQQWPGPMCSPEHCDHLKIADAFGYVLDGHLVSVGQIEAYESEYAWEYGVDTLPEFRVRGFATAVLVAVTACIIQRKHVPYHYTDCYNRPSMRLPVKLGYFRYAEGLFSHRYAE